MNSRTTLIHTLAAILAACGALQTTPAAQSPSRYAITEGRLAQAMAEVRDERAPIPADVLTMRMQRGEAPRPRWEALFLSVADAASLRDKDPAPFTVYVASPYMRAQATAFEAKRRFVDPPPLTAAALNVDGILVSVLPGGDFARADAIDDVVVKRFDGRLVRAVRQDVQPLSVQNRQGASRDLSAGAFYFRLEDFEQLPVTVICIGRLGNYEIAIGFDDLRF